MVKRNKMTPSCYEGCMCKQCMEKKIPGSVESGLSSRESLGRADSGTVKSFDLVEGHEFRSDKTGNDAGGVF